MQQSSNSRTLEKAISAELEDEQRLLETVVRAHLDTCDFTRDKIEPMLQRARDHPSYTACPPTLVSINIFKKFYFEFPCLPEYKNYLSIFTATSVVKKPLL